MNILLEKNQKLRMAWAAGLFEGEGSISLIRREGGRLRPNLSITSTDLDVLERFKETVECGSINGPYQHGKNGSRHKPQFLWRASGWKVTRRLFSEWQRLLGDRRYNKFIETLESEPIDLYAQPKYRKFTKDQVVEIRKRLATGETQRSIAQEFKTDQARISQIKLRKVYAEI